MGKQFRDDWTTDVALSSIRAGIDTMLKDDNIGNGDIVALLADTLKDLNKREHETLLYILEQSHDNHLLLRFVNQNGADLMGAAVMIADYRIDDLLPDALGAQMHTKGLEAIATGTEIDFQCETDIAGDHLLYQFHLVPCTGKCAGKKLVVAAGFILPIGGSAQQDDNELSFLEQAYQAAPHPVIGTTLQGVILRCNPAAQKLLGAGRNTNLTGSSLHDRFIEQEGRRFFDYCISALKEKPSEESCFTMHDFSGRQLKVCINTKVIRGTRNRPIEMIHFIEDQTEKEKLLRALSESEERFRLVSQATSDYMWDWDPKRDLVWRCEAAYEVFGDYEEEETSFNWWVNRIHPDDRSRVLSGVKRFIQGSKERFVQEYRLGKAGGDYAYVKDRFIAIRDSNGEMTRLLGAFTDITTQKRQQLSLQELNSSKDRFFSLIAHDLKSPLSGLLGYTEYLANTCTKMDEEKLLKLTGRVYKQSKNVYNLVENLLYWARFQSGHMEYKPEEAELQSILADVITLFEPVASAKQIAINFEREAPVVVTTDVFMVTTILRNLLSNAIKFSHKGGTINVSINPLETWVMLSVQDFGIGMSKSILDNLFQLDEITSRDGTASESGNGLGLILANDFARKIGGRLQFRSEQNQGTEANLYLKI